MTADMLEEAKDACNTSGSKKLDFSNAVQRR